jgi:hypothetical protein
MLSERELEKAIGTEMLYRRSDGQYFSAKIEDVRRIAGDLKIAIKYRVENRFIRVWVDAERVTERGIVG